MRHFFQKTMLKFRIFIFGILVASDVCAQSSQPAFIMSSHVLISEYLQFHESNPAHAEESDLINNLFVTALKEYYKHQFTQSQIQTAFNHLHNYTTSVYEDGPDMRRQKVRQCLCLSAIALMTDKTKYRTYIYLAEAILCGGIIDTVYIDFEREYCGLLLLELLMKYECNEITSSDIKRIRNFLYKKKDRISTYLFDKINDLLDEYSKYVVDDT